MTRPILQVENLNKAFGGKKVLQDLNFEIMPGEVVGIIGPNGAGKSTLMNVLLNIIKQDSGKIIFDDYDISNEKTNKITRLGIARSFQDSKPLPQISVHDNIDISFRYNNTIRLKNVFFNRKALKAEEAANLTKIKELLEEVGIPDKLNVQAKDLSYGQGKLIEILKIMVSDSKLVLLDEPFSGLFAEMIKLITAQIRKLAAMGKTIILIEHNMKLIEEICDRVIVLDAGAKIADGTFKEVTSDPTVIESYLGK